MESEFVRCKRCGIDYVAPTQEVASYFCPNCMKPKGKVKVLDSVSAKELTGFPVIRKTQDPVKNENLQMEKRNGKEES